jgi:CRP-like cAMP-binding protein
MKIGQHFGELALINDAPRSATVIALTNCEFAILGRNDFDLVIKKNEAK